MFKEPLFSFKGCLIALILDISRIKDYQRRKFTTWIVVENSQGYKGVLMLRKLNESDSTGVIFCQ